MIKKLINRIAQAAGLEIRDRRVRLNQDLYRSLYPEESLEKRRFYNVSAGGHLGFGCGFRHPFWTNIDVKRNWGPQDLFDPKCDIEHDLQSCKPLPVGTGTAELIHSRFTVEHINDEAAQVFFDEAFRVLKKGGVIRLVAPNIDLDYRAYLMGDLSYYSWREMFSSPEAVAFQGYRTPLNQATLEQLFLVHFAGNASTVHSSGGGPKITDEEFREWIHTLPQDEALNRCTARCSVEVQRQYRQNHINWWNFDKFARMLKKAGFNQVYATGPNQSLSPVMRQRYLFDDLYQEVALYVEATTW